VKSFLPVQMLNTFFFLYSIKLYYNFVLHCSASLQN
jgi:hypothetical protein